MIEPDCVTAQQARRILEVTANQLRVWRSRNPGLLPVVSYDGPRRSAVFRRADVLKLDEMLAPLRSDA